MLFSVAELLPNCCATVALESRATVYNDEISCDDDAERKERVQLSAEMLKIEHVHSAIYR